MRHRKQRYRVACKRQQMVAAGGKDALHLQLGIRQIENLLFVQRRLVHTEDRAGLSLEIKDRISVKRRYRAVARRDAGGNAAQCRYRPSRVARPAAVAPGALRRLRPHAGCRALAPQGITVSRETLRKWMSVAGLWQIRSRRVKQVHVWRPRRSCFGELLMMDSSPYP